MAEKKPTAVTRQPAIKKDSTTVRNKPVVAEKKSVAAEKIPAKADILFTRENYKWMLIGAAIVALGMILLSGGKNPNPNQFDTNLVYSTTRITIAPILIVAGLLIEIYAIFKKPKTGTP